MNLKPRYVTALVATTLSLLSTAARAQPNLTPYQPGGYSDKIIVSTVPGTNTDAGGILPTDSLYLDWAWANIGDTSTSVRFYTDLYVDAVLTASFYTDPPFRPVAAGDLSWGIDYSLGSLSAGVHTLTIKTDSTNAIAESNETDNEYTRTITVTNPFQSGSWVLPSSAFRLGANGAEFHTDVRILNLSPSPLPVTVTATFYDQASGTTVPAAAFPVAGTSQASFDNVLQSLFGKTLASGPYGPIRFDSTGPIIVSSSVNNVNACGTGATSGQWLPGIDKTKAMTVGAIPHLAVSANASSGYRTNLVVMNPGNANATATVKVMAGARLLSSGTIGPLGANGFSQVPLDSAATFPGVAGFTDANLWVEFTSDQPVLAFASVINNASGDPFAVVATPDAGSGASQPGSWVLPSSAFRAGLNGAEFHTDVRILNLGTAPVTVTATFYDQASGGTVQAPTFSVAGRGQASFDNVLQSLFGKTLASGPYGPIRFDSTGPIIVSSSVNNVNACGTGATSGQWLPGIDKTKAMTVGAIPQLAVSANASSGYRTNLVVMNPGNANATVTVKVMAGGGVLLSSGTIGPLGANGFSQVALGSPETFPGVAGTTDANLWVDFTSDQPVFAFASVINNASGDPFAVVATPDALSSHPGPALFSQQGPKLVGTGATGAADQGWSVSLSGDGNTAIVGGPGDDTPRGGGNASGAGAAWIWTRSGGVWNQQGTKLVGSGIDVRQADQGYSVSLSADGDTAIVGGPQDYSSFGAAWVWTRSGGVWKQQGTKLIGSDAAGKAFQGYSVSLSADGNTAIIGGYIDNGVAGAAWIWTRTGGVWAQQGPKLVGSGAIGGAGQGHSVSLSADGNTAIVGGPYDNSDNSNAGAVWAWTRSGGVWTQQGPKLVGSDAVGKAYQGHSVSLSADGNTAIVGGWNDHGQAGQDGAAWVWTRSGGVWTQQGPKLVGSGGAGSQWQGYSVSLSADGNTAIVGGGADNSGAGAAWVWTRSGGVWTQQGTKLVGSGTVGKASQGWSVSLSGDGKTAIVGGPYDNSSAGAAWVFTASGLVDSSHSGSSRDFNRAVSSPPAWRGSSRD